MNTDTVSIAIFAVIIVYIFVLRNPKFVEFANNLLGDIKVTPGGAGAVG